MHPLGKVVIAIIEDFTAATRLFEMLVEKF